MKSGPRWVRKRVSIDPRKLRVARRLLRVKTDAEAIDAALDLIAFPRELERGFAAVHRAGGIEDVFTRRHRQPSGV
jgi:hypothetical protein